MLETSIGRTLNNSIHNIRRPVDYGTSFHESGMTLITDYRSDRYLMRYSNECSKLATPQQEGAEEDS